MNKIQSIKMAISKTAGRSGLIIKKYSPEILMTVGISGVIVSTVMACKATLKAEEVLDNAKKKIDIIHTAKETCDLEKYSESDYKKDLTVAYVQTGVDFIRLYGPAVTLGVVSIGCILGGYGIMKKRNIALMAAYKALEQNFTTYRKRVIEELGEEKDRQFRTGIRAEEVVTTEVDENGKKIKKKETVEKVDPNAISIYARFFDEFNPNWTKTPEYNLIFLKCQQQYANDLLQSRGHVFLNEVYDMLGIPRSQAGQIVGWVKGYGDDFIDFGIFNSDNAPARDFVNGYERSILLDFNVAGVIYNMI